MNAHKPTGFSEPRNTPLRALIVEQKAAPTEKTLSSSMVPMGSSIRSIGTSITRVGTVPLAARLGAPPNQGVLARQHSAAPSRFAQFLADVEQIGAAITFGLQRISRTLEPVLDRLRNPSPETIEVIEGLLIAVLLHEKYNGGNKAILRAIVEAQLGRKADGLLVTKLQEVRTKPLSEFFALLDHHKLRLGRNVVPNRARAVRAGIRKSYASLEEACSILAEHDKWEGEHDKWSRERVLAEVIEEVVCEQGASQRSDDDLRRAATNRLRRDATESRKKPSANSTDVGVFNQADVENEIEAWEIRLFLQQVADAAARQKPVSQQELESFAIAAYMTHKEAASVLGRSDNQIKQERLRANRKLRRAAGDSSL